MTNQHIHLIGIGGSGLSAIALYLLEGGWVVSGSDRQETAFTEALRKKGATVYIGHAPEHIQNADLVVRSSAVMDDNPEVAAAVAAGIPVLKRAAFLNRLTAGKKQIAVAGTHGKTTTTAMIAWILYDLGLDPSYIIGGVSLDLQGNAHLSQGPYFVIEADEYDNMFLGLQPDIAVVTVMEHDHPDCFPTPEEYQAAFRSFIKRIKPGGTLILNADDPDTISLEAHANPDTHVFEYSLSKLVDFTPHDLHLNLFGGYSFEVHADSESAAVELHVPGQHNASNALGALAACKSAGVKLDQAAGALALFSGTGRRFEVLGSAAGVTVVDDYGHHPTEIQATLAAARSKYPTSRIWALWQPHTYTRTNILLERFADSFKDADQVLVTDVYAAREQPSGVYGPALANKLRHRSARYCADLDGCTSLLLNELRRGDVLIVLTAGDAVQVSRAVLAQLRQRESEGGSQ